MGAHFDVEYREDCVVKAPTLTFLKMWSLEEWAAVVNSLADIPGIQPVRLEDGKVVQPMAPGRALLDLRMDPQDERVADRVAAITEEVRRRGYELGNLHHGNVFYEPETGEVTIVDLGDLRRIQEPGGET